MSLLILVSINSLAVSYVASLISFIFSRLIDDKVTRHIAIPILSGVAAWFALPFGLTFFVGSLAIAFLSTVTLHLLDRPKPVNVIRR